MKTKDFLKQHEACKDGAKWALSIGEEMDAVWNAMIAQDKRDWLLWTVSRSGVFPDTVLRKLACRFVRETPLPDGRKVWDLLTDGRSRRAVEVAERYADGKATAQELDAAHAAAYDVAYAAREAAREATFAAACAAAAVCEADDAAYAARAAARAAADAARSAAARAAYAADGAVDAAACAAARAVNDAAYAAARDAAKAAQVQMIADLGNPFKERTD